MLGILLTLIITNIIAASLIIIGHSISGKLYFKKQIEDKLGKKIRFRDIK